MDVTLSLLLSIVLPLSRCHTSSIVLSFPFCYPSGSRVSLPLSIVLPLSRCHTSSIVLPFSSPLSIGHSRVPPTIHCPSAVPLPYVIHRLALPLPAIHRALTCPSDYPLSFRCPAAIRHPSSPPPLPTIHWALTCPYQCVSLRPSIHCPSVYCVPLVSASSRLKDMILLAANLWYSFVFSNTNRWNILYHDISVLSI